MPIICTFLGIIIRMYYGDHNPPHFHVQYKDYDAIINIKTLEIIKGHLPKRVMALTLEWASLNRDQLIENWQHIENGEPLVQIKPLDEEE